MIHTSSAADPAAADCNSPGRESNAGGVTHRSTKTSSTVAARRAARDLENFDCRSTAKQLVTTPRSLVACAKEGVTQDDLRFRDVKSFVHACKGNVEVARVKQQHYEERRQHLVAQCRARRRAMIEDLSHSAAAAEEQPPRRASTPAVATTADMVGTHDPQADAGASSHQTAAASSQSGPKSSHNPSRAASHRAHDSPAGSDHDHDDDASDGGSCSGSSDWEGSHRSGATSLKTDATPKILSPEEFQRQQARQRKLKVARQVDKMKRVIERNRQREEAQQEHMAATRRRMKQQEQERQQQLEREEVLRYLKQRQAKKREAELAVQREARDAATAARMEALRRENEARAAALRERDAERAALQEERRLEREREIALKQEEAQRRLDTIYMQNELLVQARAEELGDRMAAADEQRAKLQEQRDAELQARKVANERKRRENEEKRRKAEERQAARVGGYVDKAAEAERRRQEREKRRENEALLRRLQEQDEAERRERLRTKVVETEAEERARLERRLQEEEARRQRMADEKQRESTMRAAEKELVLEDRVKFVQRIQRIQDQERAEADERYQAKMNRIAQMRADVRAMDEERKKLQAEMVRARPPPGAFDQPTPGPGEYAVADAEAKLHAAPAVRLGAAPQKVRRLVGDAPGPGEYGNPVQAIRSNRGAKLPPRQPGGGALAGGSTNRSTRSQSAMSGKLPSIRGATSPGRHGHQQQPPRASTSMAARTSPAANGGGGSMPRPDDLRDEDFATDDDFEDA